MVISLVVALFCGCAPEPSGEDALAAEKLLIFHNNSGPMCLQALDWLDSIRSQHPELVIEEHLTYEPGEVDLLNQLKAQCSQSQGVSTTFGYLPIVFFQGQAFSGFNDDIQAALATLIESANVSFP
jgi:hypothetical protein